MKKGAQVARIGFLSFFISISFPSYAGPGHDHGDSPAAVEHFDGPKRQVNGDVFLPKQAQRQLFIETEQIESGSFSKTYDLAGKVIMDPNYGGKVQAIVAGRVTCSVPPEQVFRLFLIRWRYPTHSLTTCRLLH